MTRTLLAAALLFAGPALAQTTYALPDPGMTPGAVDPKVTLAEMCNGVTKTRRVNVTRLEAQIARAYNVPTDDIGVRYQADHLVPLSIGGANIVENLWPQPMAEAMIKDVCDKDIQTAVCHGRVGLVEAQRAMAENWPAACAPYVGAGR